MTKQILKSANNNLFDQNGKAANPFKNWYQIKFFTKISMSDFEDFDELYDFEQDLARLHKPISQKHKNFNEFFDEITESDFKKRYRLSKLSFQSLFDEVELPSKTKGQNIDPRFDLLCLLRYLATSSFLEVCGDLVGISKTSAHRAVHLTMRSIARLSEKYFRFPHNLQQMKDEFKDLYAGLLCKRAQRALRKFWRSMALYGTLY